jgi:SAM-dependent methyltransferase
MVADERSDAVVGDAALQTDVLEDLRTAHNYRRWIVSLASPWLGPDALEIGSGRGDYAAEWAARGHRITASEGHPARVAALRETFAAGPAEVAVRELAAPVDEDANYTAVVAINVLEHIEDDVAALRSFARLVQPGGHVVLFVPAFAMAMSEFDRQIGHFRRYRTGTMRNALVAAGLAPVSLHYVNTVGLLGWLLLVRLLGGRPRDGVPLRIFDRYVVPVLRSLESRMRPPFGQSVFAVGRVPDSAG